MAKKRRQKVEKKDEYDFKFPEFDEHEFIALELRKAKVSLIAFIFAIVMVIITFQLYTVTFPDARGPIVIGIFAVIALPLLIRFLKVDTSDFDWKNWIGSGAIYVMSWLAIFILVCNPPFSDFIEPEIDEDEIKFYYQQTADGTWQAWERDKNMPSPTLTGPIWKINISAKIIDNSAVNEDSIKIMIKGPSNYTSKMINTNNNNYQIIINNNDQTFIPGEYSYSIEAKDVYGHKKVQTGSFKIL